MSCNECRDLAAIAAELRLTIGRLHQQVADLVDHHLPGRSESALWWDLCVIYEYTLNAVKFAEGRVAATVPLLTLEELSFAEGFVACQDSYEEEGKKPPDARRRRK